MNRVVAQQELERQNFRVWLRPPFPVTVRLTQGIMTPHPPAGSGSLFLRPDFRPFFGSLRKDFIVLRDPEDQWIVHFFRKVACLFCALAPMFWIESDGPWQRRSLTPTIDTG